MEWRREWSRASFISHFSLPATFLGRLQREQLAAEDSKEKLKGNLATVLELGPRRAQSAQTGGAQP